MALRDEILADSPTGYWELQETSGTVVTDSSGNGYHGTYINSPSLDQAISLVPADAGRKSVLLDGNNQRVNIPGLPVATTEFTISISYRHVGAVGWRGLLSRDTDYSYPEGAYTIFQGVIEESDTIPTRIPGYLITENATHQLVTGKWVPFNETCRLGLVFNNGYCQLIQNTNLFKSDISVTTLKNQIGDLILAASYLNNAVANYANCYIADVAYWTTALPLYRLMAHYQSTIGNKTISSGTSNSIQVNGASAQRTVLATTPDGTLISGVKSNPTTGQFTLPVGNNTNVSVQFVNDPGDPGAEGTPFTTAGYRDIIVP